MGATNLETMSVSRRETGRLHMWVMSSMTSLVTCTTITTITTITLTIITLTMYLNVKLGPRRKGHKGRAVWLA